MGQSLLNPFSFWTHCIVNVLWLFDLLGSSASVPPELRFFSQRWDGFPLIKKSIANNAALVTLIWFSESF